MNLQKTFNIKGKTVILYGAASIGRLTCEKYERAGLPVGGFIDKRSDEIRTFKGYKVYSLSDEKLKGIINDDFYIVVSVKNVFEHTNIANKLIDLGFQNIIYMPISAINGCGNKEQMQLYDAYNNVTIGCFENVHDVPKSLKKDRYVPINESIIMENEKTVTAYISIDQLYTDKKKRQTPWFSRPVLCLLPHIDLFRLISGDNRYTCERYLRFCIESAINSDIDITEAWKKNIIKNRSMVYEHMSHAMELENEFFIRNAPVVSYDKNNGVFNLNSGKHRAAFFVSIRRKYIPVKIDKQDYEAFIDIDNVNKLVGYLSDQGIDELLAPIPHPFFYNYPCETKEFYYGFTYWLMYYLADVVYSEYNDLDFSRINILCALRDYEFIERTLARAGASITVIQKKENMMEQLIGQILKVDNSHTQYITYNCFFENFSQGNTDDKYDFIIVDLLEYPNFIEQIKEYYASSSSIIAICQAKLGEGAKCMFESVARGEFTQAYIL